MLRLKGGRELGLRTCGLGFRSLSSSCFLLDDVGVRGSGGLGHSRAHTASDTSGASCASSQDAIRTLNLIPI